MNTKMLIAYYICSLLQCFSVFADVICLAVVRRLSGFFKLNTFVFYVTYFKQHPVDAYGYTVPNEFWLHE